MDPSTVMGVTLFRLDPSVRRSMDGRTLMGGSPFRIVVLTSSERDVVDGIVGQGIDDSAASAGEFSFDDRLYRWGFVQPESPTLPGDERVLSAIDVVIPTRNRPRSVRRLLARLPTEHLASVTVVDDGSEQPTELIANEQVRVIRCSASFGPGGARHIGAGEGTARYLLFIDDDISVDGHGAEDAVSRLATFAETWGVQVIAPRIRSQAGSTIAERFEAVRGAFDRGAAPGAVSPGTRIPFVPSGMLLVRRDAYEASGGFRPDMNRGEDVDLVWRMHNAGDTVRYEPSVTVTHPVGRSWREWLMRRHGYGRSTVDLGIEHPGSVEAISISPWSVAVWALMLVGGPLRIAALALWAGSVVLLVPELRGRVDEPVKEALVLAGGGTLFAGDALAATMRRSWWPLMLFGVVGVGSLRRAGLGALVSLVLEWRRSRPEIDPFRWCAIALADELAYGSGLWCNALQRRSFGALRVRWQSIEDLIVPKTESQW